MGERVGIASAVKEYTLVMNGAECDVCFSPTDGFIAERLFNIFDSLSEKQAEYEAQVRAAAGKKEIFSIARARDAEMRESLNSALDADVCSVLFAKCSVYALADGLPGWCNLLLALMDLMDDSLIVEQKAANPRVQQYANRYKKYQQFQK